MYNLNSDVKKGTREGLGDGLIELADKNKDVVSLSSGVGDSTKAFSIKKKYPERYVETGIAEQNLVGMAAGLSLAGKIPYASSFAAFLPGRCFDQIRVSVCYSNLNVKLVSTHAGLTVGKDGASHQMMEDIAMMRALPNMKVIVPADALEAKRAVVAVADEFGPSYIRLGREKLPVFTNVDTPFVIGKAVTLKKGTDVTIIATGLMVYHSLIAAEKLEQEGISARVINMHTIKPIDKDVIIKAANETGAIVTAEEHQIYGGLGSAVGEVVVQNKLVPMKIIGMPDKFGESGSAHDLLVKYGLTDKEIIKAVKEVISKK